MSYAEVLICSSSSSNRSGACKTGRSVRSSEEAEEQDERLGHGRGTEKGRVRTREGRPVDGAAGGAVAFDDVSALDQELGA